MVALANKTLRIGISRCSDDAQPSTPTAAVTTLTLFAGCKPLFGGLLVEHTAHPVATTTMARRSARRHSYDGAAALLWRHMDKHPATYSSSTSRTLLCGRSDQCAHSHLGPFPLKDIPTQGRFFCAVLTYAIIPA